MAKRNLKFESRIINPILRCIKNNQEYLTKPENLPQLAKLGYMYNTLWYGGRTASYDNVIEEYQCDDNPKYKIEMCNPLNDKIENYIYDAWGMHVSNEFGEDWETFKKYVLDGHPLSELDKKLLKPNKTFDEWVDIKLNKKYRYTSMFPNRRRIADYLLCTIGTGYGLKNGYIIEEAGGADQDSTDYGDWKNCTFRKDIQKLVNKIMDDDGVKQVMEYVTIKKNEYEAKKIAEEIKSFGMPYKLWLETNRGKKEFLNLFNNDEKPYQYYPICNYSIIKQLDENSHPSYITAALEICEDITKNPPIIGDDWNQYQKDSREETLKFVSKFIKKYKK